MHDPTDSKGSFVDRGRRYSSAIYYAEDKQNAWLKGRLRRWTNPTNLNDQLPLKCQKHRAFIRLKTIIRTITKKRQPNINYRFRSGRDQFIKAYWKDDGTVYQLAKR